MSKSRDAELGTVRRGGFKRRRWLRAILLSLAAILMLIILAPTIVSAPVVRDRLLQVMMPPEAGQIELAGLSLGWFTPAEMRGIRYRRGTILFEAERVRCDRTLLTLARDWSNLGRIELVAPNVVLDKSQSAEPDAALIKEPGTSRLRTKGAARAVHAQVALTKGKITLLGLDHRPQWVVRDIDGKLDAPVGQTEATVTARAALGDGATALPLSVSGKLRWPLQLQAFPLGVVEAQLDCSGAELGVVQGLFGHRAGSIATDTAHAEFTGVANAQLRVQSDANTSVFRLTVGVRDLVFEDPNGEFELREPSVALNARATLSADTLRIETVQLLASGMAFDASARMHWPARGITTDLMEGHLDFSGIPLNLANPFLVREEHGHAGPIPDKELGGVASGAAEVRPIADGSVAASVKIDVANFLFVDRPNNLEVREPKLAIRSSGTVARDTLQVEMLRVTAGKTTLDAGGSSHWPVRSLATDLVEAHAAFSGIDLATANLLFGRSDAGGKPARRFIVSGQAKGSASARPTGDGCVGLSTRVDVVEFGFSLADEEHGFEVREPQAIVTAEATLGSNELKVSSLGLRTGTIQVDGSGLTRWPIRELATDLVEADVEFAGIDLSLANQCLAGAERPLDPAAIGASRATSHHSKRPPVDSGAADRTIQPRPAAGHAAAPASNGGVVLAGLGAGHINLRTRSDGALTTQTRVDVNNFSMFLPASQFKFQDPRISLASTANIVGEDLQVSELRIRSASVQAEGTGRISSLLSTAASADLSGTFLCDWESLQAHMSDMLPNGMSLAGKGRRAWSIRGPIKGRDGEQIVGLIEADLGTRFEFPEFFGLELAPVEFAAKLQSGMLRVEPIQTTLQRGKVAMRPTVRFGEEGPVATLAEGRILDRMVIDPTLCQNVLRFVNPLIASHGDLTGELSLDVEQFEMPLGSDGLQRASIRGELALDNAEFRLDDVLLQILGIAGVRVPSSIRTSQVIAVRMEEGRIYHSGLKVPIGDDYVVLDGWVGLDHKLSLRVDTPLSVKLAGGNERVQRMLRGQRIQVPISGTLERLKFDSNSITSNLQKLLQSGLRESLSSEELINGLLRKTQKK